MNTVLPGLARYTVLPVEPGLKEATEHFAVRVTEYGNGSRQWCGHCFDTTYRRLPTLACARCCDHSRAIRGYMRYASGTCHRQTLCLDCGGRRSIAKWDPDPVLDICLRDNVTRAGAYRPDPCVRCAAEGTEVHHWAPRAIFIDPDAWPTSPLCPECHREWHARIRAAKGHRNPDIDTLRAAAPGWAS